jgi:putative membrane protein
MNFKTIVLFCAFAAMAAVADKPTDKTKVPTEELLMRLHDANQDEIALGKLANEKAEADGVKSFGARLIQDHTSADKEVLAVAKEKSIDLNTTLPHSLGETGQVAGSAATSARLKMLSGKKFDQAFVRAMKTDHDKVIDLLSRADRTDPQVKTLADQLLPKLREHRRMAKRLQSTVMKE